MPELASRTRTPLHADLLATETRLYDAAMLGLTAYARARFRIRVLGAPFELRERLLIVSSHRSDEDIPVLIGALARRAHGLVRRGRAVHFVVRDDLFEPGFFAGYPAALPRPLRRALFRLDVGPVLRRYLPCHPVRRPNAMRLVQLLRAHPDVALDELLPPPLLEPLRIRASQLGRGARVAGDVVNGDFADLLWEVTEREEVLEGRTEEFWNARNRQAARDFRELVEVLRAGRPMLMCPEGRPSPDGRFGPVAEGVVRLIRRGEPAAVVPLSPAYDPLAPGRTSVLVGVGAAVDPPDGVGAILELFRRTTPLTVGSSLAAALADGDEPERRLAADVAEARVERRPFEPELADPAVRRARVAAARRAARGRDLRRLENEYRSARE